MLKFIKVTATKNVTTATIKNKKVAVIDTSDVSTVLEIRDLFENAGYGPNLTKEMIDATIRAKSFFIPA